MKPRWTLFRFSSQDLNPFFVYIFGKIGGFNPLAKFDSSQLTMVGVGFFPSFCEKMLALLMFSDFKVIINLVVFGWFPGGSFELRPISTWARCNHVFWLLPFLLGEKITSKNLAPAWKEKIWVYFNFLSTVTSDWANGISSFVNWSMTLR